MRRLLATAVTAAAFAAPLSAAEAYTCGGVVDVRCSGTVCPMDCFPRECLVWVDPLHSPFTAVCVQDVLQA